MLRRAKDLDGYRLGARDGGTLITRDYEMKLQVCCGREGYWVDEPIEPVVQLEIRGRSRFQVSKR